MFYVLQVLHGYVNIRKLTITGGVRLTNTNCARLAKEMPLLNSLCHHFPTKTSDGIQVKPSFQFHYNQLLQRKLGLIDDFFFLFLLRSFSTLQDIYPVCRPWKSTLMGLGTLVTKPMTSV